ncbi:MAG: hypothetical protein ACYDEX_24595 [Mobilitalea sp.]
MQTKTQVIKQQQQLNMQERLREIISTIASFLLSLALLGLTLLIVIQWSGFSKNAFYKNMSVNSYYDNVKNSIIEEAESITIPIGLPVTVLDHVFTSSEISKEVNGYIDAAFSDETYFAQTNEMANRLEANVRVYLGEVGITPDAEVETNLKTYITSITKEYTDQVQMPLLFAFLKARTVYDKIYTISIVACGLFALICLTIIWKLHQSTHNGLRFVIFAMIATGLMTGIVPFVMLQSGFAKRINLSPEYFYNFFTNYVTNIFKTFLAASIMWFIVSILLILVNNLLKNREK